MSVRVIEPLRAKEAARLRQHLRRQFNESEVPQITWGPIPGGSGGVGQYRVEVSLGTTSPWGVDSVVIEFNKSTEQMEETK